MAVRVITNADDLGYGAAENQAIFDLMREELVTSATLMANGPGLDEACAHARFFPRCSFGAHLNFTEFRPLTPSPPKAVADPDGSFDHKFQKRKGLGGYRQFLYEEICRQIDRLIAKGIVVSHLDSHHHTHTLPAFLPVLRAVRKKYDIPRVRISRNLYKPDRQPGRLFLLKKALFNTALCRWCGFRTSDAFTDLETYIMLQPSMRPSRGTTEIMLHPWHHGSDKDQSLLREFGRSNASLRRSLISYREL
jgi:predicted glycoside hydrolase/deacetylase ChbG (UPF0249 family)